MAVAVSEVRSAAVAAEELVDVTVRVARAVAFAGMAQDHARTILANAGATVRLERIGGTRPERGAGTAPAQVA